MTGERQEFFDYDTATVYKKLKQEGIVNICSKLFAKILE